MIYLVIGGKKVIKMNRVVFFIGILFLLQSCASKKPQGTFFYQNGTDYKIEMIFYQNGNIEESIILSKKGDEWRRDFLFDHGNLDPRSHLTGDSIEVKFDDVKSIIYVDSNTPSERNIFIRNNYEIVSEEVFRFIFTEEDYDLAVSIK